MWRKMLLSPWGKVVAVDLKTGEVLWDVPLGTVRDLAPIPIPLKLGVPNLGGPLVTEGGLVFIGAATMKPCKASRIPAEITGNYFSCLR